MGRRLELCQRNAFQVADCFLVACDDAVYHPINALQEIANFIARGICKLPELGQMVDDFVSVNTVS